MIKILSEKELKKNLSEQEREARNIGENFETFIAAWVLLRAFFEALGCLYAALGCLLGALGRLFGALGCLVGARGCLLGASWVPFGPLLGPPGRVLGPLGRLLGPLGAILKFESEFGQILAPQRVPKGSQKGVKMAPKWDPKRTKIEDKFRHRKKTSSRPSWGRLGAILGHFRSPLGVKNVDFSLVFKAFREK